MRSTIQTRIGRLGVLSVADEFARCAAYQQTVSPKRMPAYPIGVGSEQAGYSSSRRRPCLLYLWSTRMLVDALPQSCNCRFPSTPRTPALISTRPDDALAEYVHCKRFDRAMHRATCRGFDPSSVSRVAVTAWTSLTGIDSSTSSRIRRSACRCHECPVIRGTAG